MGTKPSSGAIRADFMNMPTSMKAIEEQTRRNMEIFQNAMKMFTSFPSEGSTAPEPEAASNPKKPEKSDELADLKDQIAAMQRKLEQLGK